MDSTPRKASIPLMVPVGSSGTAPPVSPAPPAAQLSPKSAHHDHAPASRDGTRRKRMSAFLSGWFTSSRDAKSRDGGQHTRDPALESSDPHSQNDDLLKSPTSNVHHIRKISEEAMNGAGGVTPVLSAGVLSPPTISETLHEGESSPRLPSGGSYAGFVDSEGTMRLLHVNGGQHTILERNTSARSAAELFADSGGGTVRRAMTSDGEALKQRQGELMRIKTAQSPDANALRNAQQGYLDSPHDVATMNKQEEDAFRKKNVRKSRSFWRLFQKASEDGAESLSTSAAKSTGVLDVPHGEEQGSKHRPTASATDLTKAFTDSGLSLATQIPVIPPTPTSEYPPNFGTVAHRQSTSQRAPLQLVKSMEDERRYSEISMCSFHTAYESPRNSQDPPATTPKSAPKSLHVEQTGTMRRLDVKSTSVPIANRFSTASAITIQHVSATSGPVVLDADGHIIPATMEEPPTDDEDAIEMETRLAEAMFQEEKAKAIARTLWEETNDAPVAPELTCEWLGKNDPWRARVRKEYMDMFPFQGMKLEEAFRRFCRHVYLKGETQVIDRVLQEFARRYYDCNSNGPFESADVVYGLAYSILLLNTDLHVAKGISRMTRATFVRNTLATIAAYSNIDRPATSVTNVSDNTDAVSVKSSTSDRAASPSARFDLTVILKDMYNSVKSKQLEQPTAVTHQQQLLAKSQSDNLRAARSSSNLSRSRSISMLRRMSSFNSGVNLTANLQPSSASTSGLSMRGQGHGVVHKDGASPSPDSVSLRSPQRKSSTLSVSAMSQSSQRSYATTRDGTEDADSVVNSPTLKAMIMAAPIHYDADDQAGVHSKSGLLSRKHLFERSDKKANQRSWKDCHVMVERGEVKMYKASSSRGFGATDGSELTDVALQLGHVSLRHSLAVQLPPPGYSRTRPHVFALQLPNGGVYLFQGASAEDVRGWVSVCNYWAARESKEPMPGGIDNREYGWGRASVIDDEEMEPKERQSLELEMFRPEAVIAEWNPPQPTMVRSTADAATQLKNLLAHIARVERELVRHKTLRKNVDKWQLRSPNHARAFANWERKSQYLLRELIKYQTYADCLGQDMVSRNPSSRSDISRLRSGSQYSVSTDDASSMQSGVSGIPDIRLPSVVSSLAKTRHSEDGS